VPAKQPATPTTSNVPATELTAEQVSVIRQQWRQTVGKIQPITLAALLRDAKIVGPDGEGRLVLTFKHAFHRDKVNQEGNRQKVEQALSRIHQQHIIINCMLEKDWSAPAAPPAAPPVASHQPPPPEAPPETEDELVKRAQEELGAVPRFSE
jgi:hypothetical protein